MSEPDPAPAPSAAGDPGPDRIKRRSKTSRRVKTKVRTADSSNEERRKARKKILNILQWAGLWVLAMAAIWIGLKMFIKPPPTVLPQGLHRPAAPAGSPWSA